MQEVINETKVETKAKKKARVGIPIKAFFRACLHNWYWFIISMIVCGTIAFLYSKSQKQFYQARSVIAINNSNSRQAGSASQTFSDLGISSGGVVFDELFKLRSVDLMENVVKHLGLNIQYYGHVYLRDVNIYKKSPVQITPLNDEKANYMVTIVPKSESEFEFMLDDSGEWKKARFGNRVNTKYGPIAITKTPHFNKQMINFKVLARVFAPRAIASSLRSALTTEQSDRYSSIVNLTLTCDNYEMALDVLNALIVAYNQMAIDDKNSVARSTEEFIADRITSLSQDLSGVDSRIASLRSAGAATQMYADASSGIRYQDNLADVNMQISLASFIRDHLRNMGNDQLIPSNTGISNVGIESQIAAYNELMLRYQKLSATASQELPVVQELSKEMATMRANIMATLNNYINSLTIKHSNAISQESRATGSMAAVPANEKAIAEVTRQQNVKEQLYLYLLNKREENALQLAITEPSAKVIENASGSSAPVAPLSSRIILMGLFIGFLIPATILYIIYWVLSLDTKIHTRHDIEAECDIPIVGELPCKSQSQKGQEIIVTATGNDRITEAFRIVRSNLDFVVNKASDSLGTVMQLTSTMSGEGKSFIALNLALTYATADKKVVVIDLDLRKGRFSEYVKIERANGVSAFLAGKITNINDVIVKGTIHDNLDIVPLGAIPPNPTGLLMGDHLEKLLNELRRLYDYVIIDTVPFGVIADASLINRFADVTLYIVRDGMIERDYLNDIERMCEENKFKNLVFLINDININNKRYGYGGYSYGYSSYGYGYHSGYTYGDSDDKPATLKSRLLSIIKGKVNK